VTLSISHRPVHDGTRCDCDSAENHSCQTHFLCLHHVALAISQVRRKRGPDPFSSRSTIAHVRPPRFGNFRQGPRSVLDHSHSGAEVGNESRDRSVTRSRASLCRVKKRARCGHPAVVQSPLRCRRICTGRNVLRSKCDLLPDWGARGARLFRGQAPYLSVTSRPGECLILVRAIPSQNAVSRPAPCRSRVRSSWHVARNPHRPTLVAVVEWIEATTSWVMPATALPRTLATQGPSVCSDSGQGREQWDRQDHGSASGTSPSASKDHVPARGPCPHPSSAPTAGQRAVADPSPVPLPHGG